MSERQIEVRMQWGDAEDLPALYANHVFVSHLTKDMFYLIFGEWSPPVILSPTEEDVAALEASPPKIKPLVKLVITPRVMASMVKALQDNLRKYEERQEEPSGDVEAGND